MLDLVSIPFLLFIELVLVYFITYKMLIAVSVYYAVKHRASWQKIAAFCSGSTVRIYSVLGDVQHILNSKRKDKGTAPEIGIIVMFFVYALWYSIHILLLLGGLQWNTFSNIIVGSVGLLMMSAVSLKVIRTSRRLAVK